MDFRWLAPSQCHSHSMRNLTLVQLFIHRWRQNPPILIKISQNVRNEYLGKVTDFHDPTSIFQFSNFLKIFKKFQKLPQLGHFLRQGFEILFAYSLLGTLSYIFRYFENSKILRKKIEKSKFLFFDFFYMPKNATKNFKSLFLIAY